jgi:hypothetical protein
MDMSSHQKHGLDILTGLLLSLLCVLASAWIIRLDAGTVVERAKFGEASATQNAQLIYLFLTGLLFAGTAYQSEKRRSFSILMAGGTLVLMIREMDGMLDHLYHGAWLPLAATAALSSCILAGRWRKQLLESITEFTNSPAFGAFIAAGLSIFVFSRLFGMKELWKSFFEVPHLTPAQHWVKNAVEEGSELFGYTLLFLSSYAFFRFIRRPAARFVEQPKLFKTGIHAS